MVVVGDAVVGAAVGATVGGAVGAAVGDEQGTPVGVLVETIVKGKGVGTAVVGDAVGWSEIIARRDAQVGRMRGAQALEVPTYLPREATSRVAGLARGIVRIPTQLSHLVDKLEPDL